MNMTGLRTRPSGWVTKCTHIVLHTWEPVAGFTYPALAVLEALALICRPYELEQLRGCSNRIKAVFCLFYRSSYFLSDYA
jgi:hypothetical protein